MSVENPQKIPRQKGSKLPRWMAYYASRCLIALSINFGFEALNLVSAPVSEILYPSRPSIGRTPEPTDKINLSSRGIELELTFRRRNSAPPSFVVEGPLIDMSKVCNGRNNTGFEINYSKSEDGIADPLSFRIIDLKYNLFNDDTELIPHANLLKFPISSNIVPRLDDYSPDTPTSSLPDGVYTKTGTVTCLDTASTQTSSLPFTYTAIFRE